MKLMTKENIPEWAVGYLEYGECDSLNDEEVKGINEWLRKNFPNGYVCDYHWEESVFSPCPLWGLPAMVVPVDFYSVG